METITIQVSPEIAPAYRQSEIKKQQELEILIKMFFDDDLEQKKLIEVMEEIADKAEKRGLTPEILASILEDEQ
ncbi:MAG: hypothetical protein DSM107014_01875 [Gomphosphaeria aponina SAG 52.96 = DSM 107014]|uniref:Uncharacterized protein n=1 Tax=Gomphosphaeria aponina SAG 52.96 = DSM 107014 TaxID=1521640 RepID=A0A941GTA6_9CHRO|nr:hypothetical protein [Gomphosphaeria aponina SAG 52.96 = DSM 107014]